jgi:NADPH2:quinone reductase
MQCLELGPPERLTEVELPDPLAGSGEVLVEVHAAGVNFPDALIVAGTYQTRYEPPFAPGSEVAGVVRAVGDGVTNVAVGDRVMAFCGVGGYAELVAVPAERVHRIPDTLSMPVAACLPVAYGTVYHGLVDRARIGSGETLLVLGAAGGVGVAAVELGVALGARVIAAASSAEKLALCRRRGAAETLDYQAEDLASRLRELCPDGVDVVCDPVGGAAAETAVRQLAWAGRFLTIGYAAGEIPKIALNRLLLKEADAMGVLWGAWARRFPGENARNMDELMRLAGQGAINPEISEQFVLGEAVRALQTVVERRVLGKVVLRVKEEAA